VRAYTGMMARAFMPSTQPRDFGEKVPNTGSSMLHPRHRLSGDHDARHRVQRKRFISMSSPQVPTHSPASHAGACRTRRPLSLRRHVGIRDLEPGGLAGVSTRRVQVLIRKWHAPCGRGTAVYS